MQRRLPHWLKKDIINTEKTRLVRNILRKKNLNTVCDNARCPNKGECYAKNTATFLILGNICTRNCRFCGVNSTVPKPVNPDEPVFIAEAVQELNLDYAVITSVTRDDLVDGGAGHFAQTIKEIRKLNSKIKIEVLTPDFKGDKNAIDLVIGAKPDVFNHNVETVKRLYPEVRPQANYERSLKFLEYIKMQQPEIYTKSGFMLGLGETIEEIIELLEDLNAINCDIITVGQYIQPTKSNIEVKKYLEPEEFKKIEEHARKIGVKHIFASPLARSSYKAKEILNFSDD